MKCRLWSISVAVALQQSWLWLLRIIRMQGRGGAELCPVKSHAASLTTEMYSLSTGPTRQGGLGLQHIRLRLQMQPERRMLLMMVTGSGPLSFNAGRIKANVCAPRQVSVLRRKT